MQNKVPALEMRFNFINTQLPPYDTIEKTKVSIKKELERTIYDVTGMPSGSMEIMPGLYVGCWDIILPIFITGLQHLGTFSSILSLPQTLDYLYNQCEEKLRKFTGGRNTAKDFPGYIRTNFGIYDAIKYCTDRLTEDIAFLPHALEIIVKDVIVLCRNDGACSTQDVKSIVEKVRLFDITTPVLNMGINFDIVTNKACSYLAAKGMI